MYTVAMIGAGAISANHLAAVAQHPDTQLIAVADLDLERRSRQPRLSAPHPIPITVKCSVGKHPHW